MGLTMPFAFWNFGTCSFLGVSISLLFYTIGILCNCFWLNYFGFTIIFSGWFSPCCLLGHPFGTQHMAEIHSKMFFLSWKYWLHASIIAPLSSLFSLCDNFLGIYFLVEQMPPVFPVFFLLLTSIILYLL